MIAFQCDRRRIALGSGRREAKQCEGDIVRCGLRSPTSFLCCVASRIPHTLFVYSSRRNSPMATSLRAVSELTAQTALQRNSGYGVAGARSPTQQLQVCCRSSCSVGSSISGSKLQMKKRQASEKKQRSVNVWASAAEAIPVDYSTMNAEQTDLLAKRKAILQAEEKSRAFVVTEVETSGYKDWHASKVVGIRDVAAGVRCVTVETEVSRELVSLENAYTKPGQAALVRLNGKELKAVPSCSPFSDEINATVLYKLRGDIPAGTTKLPAYSLSVKANLELHVEESTTPELYNVAEGQELEVGPFESTGLDLRPILYLSRFPTLVFFAQGLGVAVARSILEAKDGDNGSMNLSFRDEVRLFYSSPRPSQLAYQDKFAYWESRNVKVRTTVDDASGEEWQGAVGSLTSLWDEDDLEYNPNTTGAIVCVGKEVRQEVMNLLEEAGIPKEQIVSWEY